MNLSTSISDPAWRRLLGLTALWTALLGAALAFFVLALDPYDTGYFALFPSHGVPHFGQRLAAASLARDPHFNAALIGNSTLQLIDPARLESKTIHPVSLTIPGTGPREQLAVARYFFRHHAETKELVIGLDGRWCEANHPERLTHPFPFWLYRNDRASYAGRMMQIQNVESAFRKIRLLRGKEQPMTANGYNDYDSDRRWNEADFYQRLAAPDEEGAASALSSPPFTFSGIAMLDEFIARVPKDVKIILVIPPQFTKITKAEERSQQQACVKGFRALAEERPHTTLIDFLNRPDLTEHDIDYWDRVHYRSRVARAIESEIKKTQTP